MFCFVREEERDMGKGGALCALWLWLLLWFPGSGGSEEREVGRTVRNPSLPTAGLV